MPRREHRNGSMPLMHQQGRIASVGSNVDHVDSSWPQRDETQETDPSRHQECRDGSRSRRRGDRSVLKDRGSRQSEETGDGMPVTELKKTGPLARMGETKPELGGFKQRRVPKDRGYRRSQKMGSAGPASSVIRGELPARGMQKTRTLAKTREKTGAILVESRSKRPKVDARRTELRVGLDMCSKKGDVMGAIVLYDSALKGGIRMEQYHYNVLLYLCSSAAVGVVHPAKSGRTSNGIASTSPSSNDGSSSEILIDTEDNAAGYVQDHHRNQPNSTASYNLNSGVSKTDSSKDQTNSIPISDDLREYARTRGFEIFKRMCLEKVPMSEATMTAVARMAMSMGNGDLAFQIVKQMKELGITQRLRSYGPALTAFCNNGDVEKAFEVETHMLESGVTPEEPELEALLRASVVARRGDKVYYLLQKLRTNVRQVSPSTVELIETWFRSSTASKVGKRKWDAGAVMEAIENGGGGWHGLGWLGKGKWNITRSHIDSNGACLACGEKLVTVDLDPEETENFATSVVAIAGKRERKSSFEEFQKWLEYHGPFEAVVDAANVGLSSTRSFSLSKVNAVVNAIRQKLASKKWPLIILHHRRLSGDKMDNKKLVEKWKHADAVYATPTGSNDDWYWLYAAIRCKCLLVTNDEMRDHIFQLLGNDFFPKWKERHQVRFTYNDGRFKFQMPPPFSVVIQESEKGHWHIPISGEYLSETERTWLCVTRHNPRTAQNEESS